MLPVSRINDVVSNSSFASAICRQPCVARDFSYFLSAAYPPRQCQVPSASQRLHFSLCLSARGIFSDLLSAAISLAASILLFPFVILYVSDSYNKPLLIGELYIYYISNDWLYFYSKEFHLDFISCIILILISL